MAITGKQVKVFINVVGGWIGDKVAVRGFGSPYFGGNIDDKRKSGRGQPCNRRRGGYRA